jgi:hypothetical protein
MANSVIPKSLAKEVGQYVDVELSFDTGLSGAGEFEAKATGYTFPNGVSKVISLWVVRCDTRLSGLNVNMAINGAISVCGRMMRGGGTSTATIRIHYID